MRKILLVLLFAFYGSAIYANDFFIDEINIDGLERIERETVISYSNLSIDDPYSNEIGNDALKKLFETDLFSDVEIQFEDGVLNIEVSENPTINLIKFTRKGRRSTRCLQQSSLNQTRLC